MIYTQIPLNWVWANDTASRRNSKWRLHGHAAMLEPIFHVLQSLPKVIFLQHLPLNSFNLCRLADMKPNP